MGIVKLFEDFHEFDGEMSPNHMMPNHHSMGKPMETKGFSNRQLAGKTRIAEEDTTLLDTPEWTIVIPHTHRASCYWGKGAHWDTAVAGTNGEACFDTFNKKGDLIIIIDKETGMKYQMHINHKLFFDQNDRAVDCGDFFSVHPEIYDAIETHITPEEQRLFSQLCGM